MTPELGEFRRGYLYEGGKWTPITPELKWDVSRASLDEKKAKALYTVNEGGYSKVFGLDAKTWKPLEMPKLPAADQTTLRLHHDRRPVHGLRRRHPNRTAAELGLRLDDEAADPVGRPERPRGRHEVVRRRDARVLPGA